jgi:hypothetical protein
MTKSMDPSVFWKGIPNEIHMKFIEISYRITCGGVYIKAVG